MVFASLRLLVLVSCAMLAPTPALFAAPPNLSLDVKVTGSGGASNASSSLNHKPGGKPLGGGWVTATQDDYKQKRDRESSLDLEVDVRNVSHDQEVASLEWYFFSKDLDGGGDDKLFDHGSEAVNLGPAQSNDYSVRSKTLKELHKTNGVNALGDHIHPKATVKKSGAKVSGWIVRLVVNDAPVAIQASSPTLQAMGARDESLERLTGKLEKRKK